MNIYVYWNRNNNDCVKIFHFMSPNDQYSVVEYLNKDNTLQIERAYKPFDDVTKIVEGIRNSKLIIFLTHGAEDMILKYRNNPDKELDEFILIDKRNANILKDKIVLAFCCSSAKDLGRYCVTPEIGCQAFVGFERDIVYDNGKAVKSRHIIYESYKIAFMKSLRYAVQSKCSVEQYRIKLTQLMRKEAAKAILQSENQTLHNMYSGTIEGLIALGATDQRVFE